MQTLGSTLAATTSVVRIVVFGAAVVVGVVALVDWAVRTRRLNPFGGVGRFFRKNVDPLLVPVERRVIQSGGRPSSAPFWALTVVVVGGLILIWALQFLISQVLLAGQALGAGTGAAIGLVIHWTFALLRLALLVRVISSWIRISPFSPWIRWTNPLTNWLLVPLRRIVPTIGMLDITPIVGYFGLILLERLVFLILP